MDLKEKIAKALSDCLSDQYDANITIKFVPAAEQKTA